MLKQFQGLKGESITPKERRLKNQLKDMMLALAGCMRSAAIHPVLPGGGRDITVFFSPSRSNRKSVLSALVKPNRCVCCNRQTKLAAKKRKQKEAGLVDHGDNDAKSHNDKDLDDAYDNLDDDEVNGEDDDDDGILFEAGEDAVLFHEEVKDLKIPGAMRTENEKGTGDILPIPASICMIGAQSMNKLRHYACESCLSACVACPKCEDLFSRLKYESGMNQLLKETKSVDSNTGGINIDMEPCSRRVICTETFGGFRTSAKIEAIVSAINDKDKLPVDEKVLLVSFFKGSLDLLEAALAEINVGTARFDGDISKQDRHAELERFKSNLNCRVLLMTIQTRGTGLNLVEANHVWFVDRFCEPFIDQLCSMQLLLFPLLSHPVDLTLRIFKQGTQWLCK